jgi:RNA polymerase sigma-70 factor (ECF subfamily)
VTAVLQRLPELYRIPLVLVSVDGFLTKQVARMLDVPLGTVLARLHRGRKLFEKQMWDDAAESGLLRKGPDDQLLGGDAPGTRCSPPR